MHRKVNLGFMLAAGLLGGVCSRYLTPTSVLAQAKAPKEIQAQSFVLVDEKGNIVGTFKTAPPYSSGLPASLKQPSDDQSPAMVLLNRDGRVIWRADAPIFVQATNDR